MPRSKRPAPNRPCPRHSAGATWSKLPEFEPAASNHLPSSFACPTAPRTRLAANAEPAFSVQVMSENGHAALAAFDELAVAEAYMDGDLDIEGDLLTALKHRPVLGDPHPFKYLFATYVAAPPLRPGRARQEVDQEPLRRRPASSSCSGSTASCAPTRTASSRATTSRWRPGWSASSSTPSTPAASSPASGCSTSAAAGAPSCSSPASRACT